jgi:hypothetical protein
MPPVVHLVLLIFAFVLFVLASWQAAFAPEPTYRRLVAAGLACLTASMITW